MSEPAFSGERGTPVFSSGSSEFRAELLRYLRVPVTLAMAGSLIVWLIGTPAIGWEYDYRGTKSNVIRSRAITITGKRLTFPGAIPLVLFVDSEGRITYPATRF